MTEPKWYDFTLSVEKMKERGYDNDVAIGNLFEEIGAENYVIGNEIGENGYHHYQCKVVFKTGKSMEHLVKVFAGLGRVSPSSTHNWDYVQKEGKYYRSWEKAISKFCNIQLLPWQEQAVDLLESQNDREVTVVLDVNGNHGKSWLRKYLQSNHICEYIPQMDDSKDIMRIAMKKASGTGFCFDLPRADSDRRNREMWRAIEQIKDGYLYEDRYNFTEKWIDPPKILVFTNDCPPLDTLSKDRWNIFEITPVGGTDLLMPYEQENYT